MWVDEDRARSGIHVGEENYLKIAMIVPCAGYEVDPNCNVISPHAEHETLFPGWGPYPPGSVGPVGILWFHKSPVDGSWCCGATHFSNVAGGRPDGHLLRSASPLTIEPSLLCEICGAHGYVRSGAWVAA